MCRAEKSLILNLTFKTKEMKDSNKYQKLKRYIVSSVHFACIDCLVSVITLDLNMVDFGHRKKTKCKTI